MLRLTQYLNKKKIPQTDWLAKCIFLTKQCTRKAICNSKRDNGMCIGAFDIKINDYNET